MEISSTRASSSTTRIETFHAERLYDNIGSTRASSSTTRIETSLTSCLSIFSNVLEHRPAQQGLRQYHLPHSQYMALSVLEHRPAQQGLRPFSFSDNSLAMLVLEHRPAQQGLRHKSIAIFPEWIILY